MNRLFLYLVGTVISLIILIILSVGYSKLKLSYEAFQNIRPITPTTAAQLKEILKKSRPTAEDITAYQGAYEQFLNLHKEFCKSWNKFVEVGRDYEKQSSNETSNGGDAVGTGTTKEYIRLLSLRQNKVFVDCSVSFPEKLDIGINMQQMPYESKAYIDSLDFGIQQLKKIQNDTKKALQGIPAAGVSGAPVNTEGFLDIITENCENKDGVIRCVLSIDTTNRNLERRTEKRLLELLENEQQIRARLKEFQTELTAVENLKKRAESGEIIQDISLPATS